MKRMSSIVFACAAIVALVAAPALAGDEAETTANAVKSTFKVSGMTCGGCVGHVRAAVKELGDGIQKIDVSHEEGFAKIVYNPDEVTPEKIQKAIEKVGFEAELEKTEPVEA